MKIVTSISPKRIERQQKCIASWEAIGCSITSVQSQGEAAILEPLFPNVSFTETDKVGDVFGRRKSVRVCELFKQAERSNIIVLNSDIEIRSTKEDFEARWSNPEFDELKLGIRWDEDPVTGRMELLKWGIDCFLITPRIAKRLEDIGMTMGCPAWDYWVPLVLTEQANYKVTTNKQPELIHELHEKNWSEKEYRIGIRLLQKACSMHSKDASLLIRKITGR